MTNTALLRRTLVQTAILLLFVSWTGLAEERRQADILIPLGKDRTSHIRIEIANFAPHEAPHLDIQIQGKKVNSEPIFLQGQGGNEITLPFGAGKKAKVKIKQEGEKTVYEVAVIGVPELEGTQETIRVKVTEEGYEVEAGGKRVRFKQLPDGQIVQEREEPVPEQGEDEGKGQGAEKTTVIQPPAPPPGDRIPEQQPFPPGDRIPEQEPRIGEVDPIPPQNPFPPGDRIPEQKPRIGEVDPIPPQQLPPWITFSAPQPNAGPRGGISAGVTISPNDFQTQ